MKIFKNNSPIWTVIVAAVLLFLITQCFYVDHQYPKQQNHIDFPQNKTIFFTVKEYQFSIQNRGFSTLIDSLKLWNYDQKNQLVYLREPSLMPTKYTPLLVIYDGANNTYEKQENIVPISSFPFSLQNTGAPFQVNQIDKNGKVYFTFLDKELSLASGKTYWLPYFDGFQFKIVSIQNHGLFDTKQFKLLKDNSDNSGN